MAPCDAKDRIRELEAALQISQRDLRELVDLVWNEATESQQVPSTEWADRIISAWRKALAAADGQNCGEQS